ncbi:hypothetical protein IWW57_001029 [Coemansia sp. S610]|nr:hypothetical protein GGI06_000627 [Coemansia sp. S85]KAJ2030764.1 hypothetical protein IWW57_001029 [Coemansia sp. S610]KAJ2408812.1 hypothetical protein GGI10_004788 [Coemansia sp. RSA 2530]KAJ2701993.1 hypothetical protein H4218_001080 [Coemansia sp. IMI 209128]
MFGSLNTHNNTVSQNKENAALRSVARHGKTGLLNSKPGTIQTSRMASKVFGSPAPLNTRTPSGKQPVALRAGLRDVTQTPSNRRTGLDECAPKTAKRIQGLFSPHVRNADAGLWEPEYAPPRPASLEFNATEEFGCDLDIGLMPKTQLSTAGARLKDLPPVDLALEILADIHVEGLSFSMIPPPRDLKPAQLMCQPRILVASALYPTRIPQLKRKR